MPHIPGGRTPEPVAPTKKGIPIKVTGVPHVITIELPFFFDVEKGVKRSISLDDGKDFSIVVRSIENNQGANEKNETFQSTITHIVVRDVNNKALFDQPVSGVTVEIFFDHP